MAALDCLILFPKSTRKAARRDESTTENTEYTEEPRKFGTEASPLFHREYRYDPDSLKQAEEHGFRVFRLFRG